MEFTWDSMASKLQDNAFGDKKTYDNEVDTRFWKLSRDEAGNGAAIIRFLPDANGVPFQKITKINAQNNGKGFFVSEWSPTSIGLKCPFNEKFSELWNAGEKEKAKTLKKSDRFMTNIKVIKDPSNPANEGKIFLYEMSKTMLDMLKEVMVQTEQMKALDEDPVAVYNPLEGNNFLVKIKNGDNDIPTYTSSKFSDKVNSIYESKEAAEADIVANTYSMSEWINPDTFKSYDELIDLRDRFLKEGKYAAGASEAPKEADKAEEAAVQEVQVNTGLNLGTDTAKTVETPTASAPANDDDLDAMLADLES